MARHYALEYQRRSERARALGYRSYWQLRRIREEIRKRDRLADLATSIDDLYGQSTSGHISALRFRDRITLGRLLKQAKELVGNDVWANWLTSNTTMRCHKAIYLMRYPDLWDLLARVEHMGKSYSLGAYDTAELAAEAYKSAALRLMGAENAA